MSKKRYTDCGLEMPPNLYKDNHGRTDVFRYKLPDGAYRQIKKPAALAIKVAEKANQLRIESPDVPGSFGWWKNRFVKYREETDPSLLEKQSWKNRKGMLDRFCKHFNKLMPNRVRKINQLKDWWESLTYDAQHNSRSELSRFFQYLMREEVLSINPFTNRDDKPRLVEKGKPKKSRLPLKADEFWKIYEAAGDLGLESLQLFMGYALVTDLRESDILRLRFDENVKDDRLVLTIGKSLNQRGAVKASHHCWTFAKHPLVHELVKRSRELSMKNARCPYLVSHRPKSVRVSKNKDHKFKLLPRLAISLFAQARKHAGVHVSIPANRTPATIHEIRGLSLWLAADAGEDIEILQHLAAHASIEVTKGYIAEHTPTYKEVDVVFTEKILKGVL